MNRKSQLRKRLRVARKFAFGGRFTQQPGVPRVIGVVRQLALASWRDCTLMLLVFVLMSAVGMYSGIFCMIM